MKLRLATSLITLALATQATGVSASVTGFRLPPAPTPTATPQVQGPVDTEGARPTAPRVIPTAAPTQAPSPTPTAAPPTEVSPAPSTSPPPRRTAQPTPRATQSAPAQTQRRIVPEGAAPSVSSDIGTAEVEAPSAADSLSPFPTDDAAELPTLPAPVEAQSGLSENVEPANYTLWISLIVALVIALGAGLVFWPRRQAAAANAPEIEPPSKWVRQSSDSADLPPLPSASPQSSSDIAEPPLVAPLAEQSANKAALQVKAQALSLSRSMMNATLSYRLELMNLNADPITEISVKADLVTAHGQTPIGEQVADEVTDLTESACVASIDGRETHEVKGTFSLPINAIRPIAQRNATLYVPLLRLRIDAVNADPIICTFVVGIKPPERGAKLQPFRLDEMAQTYREIGLRLLD